jgi:hypothetical protein
MWQFLKTHPLLLLMSSAFIALTLSLIINSGRFTCSAGECQLEIAEWQMHDSLWHIALAKLAFVDFPFRNPFYEGTTLAGYNYGIDLVLYALTRVGIDPFLGYFLILPVGAVALYTYYSWVYLKKFINSMVELYLTAFFLYFATSLSYVASLYATGSIASSTLRGFPVVTSLHPPSMLLNIPYAFSLSLILFLLIKVREAKQSIPLLTVALWSFITFGLKFYAGVAGFLLILFFSKRDVIIKRVLSFGLGAALAYLLFYDRPGGVFPFVFSPLAIVHIIIDDIHLFYNHSITLARYYLYENITTIPIRLIIIELATVILFLLLNWGTRAISLFLPFFNNTRKSMYSNKLLVIATLLALIPVFFVQSGGWYNTMQFMYYSCFLLSLTSATTITTLYNQHKKLGIAVSILVVVSLLPTTLEQLRYPFLPHNIVKDDEMKALVALKAEPKGVVHVNRPWAKRALIPTLAEKEMYYLDTDQLMLFLPNYQDRLDMVRKYEGGSITQIQADYYVIYKNEVASEDSVVALSRQKDVSIIFDSPEIIVFKRVGQVIQ